MKKRKCVVYKNAYLVHKTIDKKVKDMRFNLVMPWEGQDEVKRLPQKKKLEGGPQHLLGLIGRSHSTVQVQAAGRWGRRQLN